LKHVNVAALPSCLIKVTISYGSQHMRGFTG